VAPQYVAEELLQAEGFLDVHSVKSNTVRDLEVPLASGDAHLGMHFAAPLVVRLDQADPIVILAGVHIGCFELFGTERVRAIRDLKGKTVAVPDLQTGPITFLASMVAYVGLDPRKDITWVTHPRAEAKQRARPQLDSIYEWGCHFTGPIRGPRFGYRPWFIP